MTIGSPSRGWKGRRLRRDAVGLGLIALALGGCATTPPSPSPPSPSPPPPSPRSDIGYLAPTGVPPAARSAMIAQDPALVIGNLVDRLQQENLKITHLDEQAGDVVVQYSGDPKPYVDCGWIVSYRTGGLDRVPAASASASFDSNLDERALQLKRELRLDGRMMIRFERAGSQTVVSPAATYVLTKTIESVGSEGQPRGSTRETISFATGESGKFSKGTVCQPNGRLERVVLDSLPSVSIARSEPQAQPGAPVVAGEPLAAAPLAPAAGPSGPPAAAAPAPPIRLESSETRAAQVAPPTRLQATETPDAELAAALAALPCAAVSPVRDDRNGIRLTGFVSSEQDRHRLWDRLSQIDGLGAVDTSALEIAPPPTCELLQALAPYSHPTGADAGLQVATASRSTRLREGEALTLDVTLPRAARYLYLGYVQHDGQVGAITMMSVEKWAQSAGAIRYQTGFQISAPFGREMIVAVTSTKPLFDQPRPGFEPAADYIAALRQRLGVLQADGGGVATGHLFITTEPGRSS
jgi:hypothetical protein